MLSQYITYITQSYIQTEYNSLQDAREQIITEENDANIGYVPAHYLLGKEGYVFDCFYFFYMKYLETNHQIAYNTLHSFILHFILFYFIFLNLFLATKKWWTLKHSLML